MFCRNWLVIKRFSNCRLPTRNCSRDAESQETASAESSFRRPYREIYAHSQRSTKKDQTQSSPIRGKNLRKKLESVFSGLVKADILVESVASTGVKNSTKGVDDRHVERHTPFALSAKICRIK